MSPYKAAAAKYDAPYQVGSTKLAVLKRDGWTCKMPICRDGDTRIDPQVKWAGGEVPIPDEIGTIDHSVPLSEQEHPDTSGRTSEPRTASAIAKRLARPRSDAGQQRE